MSATELKYVVHNTAPNAVRRPHEIDGHVVPATIDALEVELVSADGHHGSQVLRFFGADAEAARKLYVPGARVTLTASVEPPAAG